MPNKKPKIGFLSLGCPKNQIDTDVMLNELVKGGYELVANDYEADVMLINTCAFIAPAKQESIDNILDVAWLKKNRSLKAIVVTGCLAERYRDAIMEELPEVDALLGVGSIHKIKDAVDAVLQGEKYKSFDPVDECPLGGERVVTTPEYTAYLKIAEGCDSRCTYCAIPALRGRFRSREIEDIVHEAKELEELGVRELILVAQDTTRYGLDIYGEYRLDELIRQITAETAIPWIRLLYCYPDKITDGLLREFRENPRLLRYIDIPIQHINKDILRRMNRRGGDTAIRDAVAKLRATGPDMVIRTTAIVGFPGEQEEDFYELCDFIEETKFDRFGAFAYSREEGTPAADFPDQIDEQTKQDRLDKIMQIQYEITEELNEKKVGQTFEVLYEGWDPIAESCYGRSYADAPEIDGKIYFTAKRRPDEGDFVRVKITEVVDYDLVGTAVEQDKKKK
ncbi:MAG: 30S ribosomal protein S12 methylthiotransferase RimO [Clostridiales bacterium]|nr:30S ribosomal protein S12 methylthiotransferase RimO [Clostridiales bacterium]